MFITYKVQKKYRVKHEHAFLVELAYEVDLSRVESSPLRPIQEMGKLDERCTLEKNIVKRERGVETERAEDCTGFVGVPTGMYI